MKRREFLRAGSSLALLPLLPWSKQTKIPTVGHKAPYWKYPPVEMIFIEHIGRWIPAKWMDDVIAIGQNIVLDLRKMNEDIYTHYRYKCNVFYDIFGWRSMKHNWIGYIEAPDGTTVASFDYSLPHKSLLSRMNISPFTF